jgi:heptosyltransferase-2
MISIRAPDHLGDGVMALPTVRALARLGPVEVHAPRWGAELYEGLVVRAIDDPPAGPVGVLLKPSFGAAWRWRHLQRRVGLATNGRSPLLTDPVDVPPGHRREGYTAVAAALGATVGPERWDRRGVTPDVPVGHVGLNPWSPTPTVRWPGFRALADALGDGVVFYAGPGEGDAVRALAGPHRVVEGLSLADFAAALDRCRVFVSNDSGAAHFAALCGARVLVVHGSTTAGRTGVGEAVESDPLWCRPCYNKWCVNGLVCLTRIEVDRVRAQL